MRNCILRRDSSFDTEKKAQLLRSVDRVRKTLYVLEVDARMLRERILDNPPPREIRDSLDGLAEDLQDTVGELGRDVRRVGADLRLSEAENLDQIIFTGLRTRGEALTYFRAALRNRDAWEVELRGAAFDT